MAKYEALRHYLQISNGIEITLTFQEIEDIIGFSLPASASTHRAWWANDITHSQGKEWLNAGWNVKNVNLGYEITFSKTRREI